MTNIGLRSLRKEYGAHVAIPDLTMDIEEGEFFTLLGPSGCGKTTLLRMIAGFNSIEAGTISFGNQVINDLDPGSRNIGMVFQNYALFPQMTVGKNVAFGLENRKVPKDTMAGRVTKALQTVHMEQLHDRLPGTMSGGQQQRVALARALVIEPAVLLMDEPLSNLDAKLRVEMRDTIREVQREAGITTVYVTHDQEEAMAVSDRIAVMHEGVVQQVGSPQEIYHRPANLFVADFIGKTNTLQRPLAWSGGRAVIDLDDGKRIDVTDLVEARDAGVTSVIVSARPEAITVTPDGIEAEIIAQTFLGSHTQLRARLRGGEVVEFVEYSQASAHRHEGEVVRLGFEIDRLNLFDAATKSTITRRAAA